MGPSNLPSAVPGVAPEVAVWRMSSWLVHVTVVPTLTVNSAGMNWNCLTVTAALVTVALATVVGDVDGAAPAARLMVNGGSIYLTNIIAFALWYWELDRGGPAARTHGIKYYPDFLFPQMSSPDLAPPDWEPTFVDYLYLSFTNATAFSPTDVMPLRRWAKLTMLLQSA